MPARTTVVLGALLAPATVTLVAELAWPALATTDIALAYLLGISAVAWTLGRAAALIAASASIVAFNFFFVPPYHTLYVTDTRHLVTFAVMFGGGLGISALAERGRREAAAAETARQVAHVEQVRSSLLSAVSHDLRTPLATIAGAASTLATADDKLSPAQRVELARDIESEAARLERLVANLLDLTRLAGGPAVVRRGWFPVDELVGSALRRAGAALAGRPVSVVLQAGLPLLSVDPVLVEHALLNLLENAGRHTPAGTAVHLSARSSGAAVVLEVADDGPGLGPDPGRWFQPFVQGTSGGSGLGLAIARGVAEAHGGEAHAENGPAGGARITLAFPTLSPPPTEEPPA